MIIVSTAVASSVAEGAGREFVWSWVDHMGGSGMGESHGTSDNAHLRAVLDSVKSHPGAEPLMVESGSSVLAEQWNVGRGSGRLAAEVVGLDDCLLAELGDVVAKRTGPVKVRWARGEVLSHYQAKAAQLAACSTTVRQEIRGTLASC
ncbi:hypothetical protein [Hoyosella altamirensis]|uniref:Uncharacterized protein n=1 Tax=Hoyosella altamirensis TaxID=616997 RepID=A0A839RIN2_9ACTN|nr:hypothetical protein [Hoyosella altamirensis]MBB3036139.1 hypothetical protein [Hoyosella altamirensis]